VIWAAVPRRGPFRGSIAVPGSKSFTNRALLLAALSPGPVVVRGPLACEDADAMVGALAASGSRIRTQGDTLLIEPGLPPAEAVVLDVRDSGTACRFLTAFAAATEGLDATVTGSERLCERPIGPLVEALRSLGAEIEDLGRPGYPPVRIRGRRLRGGEISVDSSRSSQFASAILLVGARFEGGVSLATPGPAVSRPYLETTREALAAAGVALEEKEGRWIVPGGASIAPGEWDVPGDYSSGAALAAAVAVAGGTLRLDRLAWPSTQADARAFDMLGAMGVAVRPGEGSVTVEGRATAPASVDASDFPDAVPVLCAVAARVEGESAFAGVEHLRIKESDRLAALEEALAAAGIRAETRGAAIRVFGSRESSPGQAAFPTRGDHRMVMAGALLSLPRGGYVESPRSVAKSYPGFFADLFAV